MISKEVKKNLIEIYGMMKDFKDKKEGHGWEWWCKEAGYTNEEIEFMKSLGALQ